MTGMPVANLSRNDAVEGERARPGRSGPRPRGPHRDALRASHPLIEPRAPEPTGEGAGWQRPRRARSPFSSESFRLKACLALVALVLAVGVSAQAESLQLLKGGKSAYAVYAEPNKTAAPSAVIALKEFRDLFKQSTGVELERIEKPQTGRPTIFFGANPYSTKAGVTTNDLATEGFRIKSVGHDIHIVGRDSPKSGPQKVDSNSGMEAGTLTGAYEFLERYLGVVFAWHDDLGTVVPRHKDLSIESMNITEAPRWSYRQYTKSPESEANGMFGRRLRLGHAYAVKHEHSWHRIMPPDVYGKQHPEWFAEVKGQRVTKHYADKRGGMVCTSNPQVVEVFAKAAIEYFNKQPGADMFSISPNDGRGFCQCTKCTALDTGAKTEAGRDIITDRYLTFFNAIAEKVAKVHPTRRLGAMIYLDYKYPPTRVKPHPMLFLIQPTNSGFAQGLGYNEQEAGWELGWQKAAGKLYKYDIWHYDETPMYMIAPATQHIIEKTRAEASHGVDGGYLYIARSYELLGAGHYVLARLMWDDKADGRALEKKYYEALYGAAAADVKAYYDLLEGRLRKMFLEGQDVKDEAIIASFNARYPGANNPAYYLAAYWPILGQMNAAIDRAYAKRKQLSPEENERLVRLIDHNTFTVHTTSAMIHAGRLIAKTGSAADQKAFKESMAKREAAKARIKVYRPNFIALVDEMDQNSHTRMLFGKPSTVVVRAPSDFNQ